MNTKNNKRRQETVRKIESVFLDFLKEQELSQIKVSDICKAAEINRGTFYANFVDIYDLADKLHERLKSEVNLLLEQNIGIQNMGADFLRLFRHIYENRDMYSFYFSLGYDDSEELKLYDVFLNADNIPAEHLHYHVSFFKSGFNGIVKKWLKGGCKETPEQMTDILFYEYRGRLQ